MPANEMALRGRFELPRRPRRHRLSRPAL